MALCWSLQPRGLKLLQMLLPQMHLLQIRRVEIKVALMVPSLRKAPAVAAKIKVVISLPRALAVTSLRAAPAVVAKIKVAPAVTKRAKAEAEIRSE